MKNKYIDDLHGKNFGKMKIRSKRDWKQLDHGDLFQHKAGFECMHCHAFVHSDPILCGVVNRNHCPYCLWSKHLDLEQPGDRLAACKAPMQPVGISQKRTHKKYGEPPGEILIIHVCCGCSSISINRIAADDDGETLNQIFQNSINLESGILNILKENGIYPLEASQSGFVAATLFGQSN